MEKLYCGQCGSTDVQIQAWVDANTHKYVSDVYIPSEYDGCWCEDCEGNTNLYTLSELWELFGDVPINDDDEIEEKFLSFSKGTNRFTVWGWFYEHCTKSERKKLFPKWYIKNKNNI